jgi:hypothetical protein
MLRGPDPQRDVGYLLGHRGLHHRLEISGQPGRIGHDVDGAQQRGGDLAQLIDIPVGPHAAAVAAENPHAQLNRGG